MCSLRLWSTGMIAFLCMLAVPVSVLADVSCPMRIVVAQELTTPQAGWTEGADELPTELAGISVFDGPPEERADLVPDDGMDTDEARTDVWNLTQNDRGYWLTCRYSSTTVTLTRRLPATVTRCEAVYETQQSFIGGAPVVRSAACGPAAP